MIFWIASTGLLLLALLIILPPILRKPDDEIDDRQQQNIDIAKDKKSTLDSQMQQGELNQQDYDNALLDLQTALALDLENAESIKQQQQGRWAVWLLIAILPLMSIGLYFQLGEYRVIENPALAEVASNQQTQQASSNLSMDDMLDQLKARLREDPDNAQGWYLLGRSYMSQRRFGEAVTAYQRTYDLVGEDAGVLFALADALAMQNNGVMQGEPEQLVARGLEISPRDPTGLWLMGLAAEQRQDYQTAYDAWTTLLPLISNDTESVAEVRKLIHMVEQRDPTLAQRDPGLTATAPEIRVLTVSVNLADVLRQKAAPEDSVFVYAKALNGPPMPLAVKRLSVRDLPAQVTLSDSDAMIPSMKLSSFDQIVIGARVSKTGNPVAQAGDLFVEIEGVDSNNPPQNMVLSIDRVK